MNHAFCSWRLFGQVNKHSIANRIAGLPIHMTWEPKKDERAWASTFYSIKRGFKYTDHKPFGRRYHRVHILTQVTARFSIFFYPT